MIMNPSTYIPLNIKLFREKGDFLSSLFSTASSCRPSVPMNKDKIIMLAQIVFM